MESYYLMHTANVYTFHVNGMHCKSCALLIEDALKGVVGVKSVHASFAKHHVVIEGDFGNEGDPNKLAADLSLYIQRNGYSLSVERQKRQVHWNEFLYALPSASVLVLLFVFLQRAGFVNTVNMENVGFVTAFLIGLIASVSSCLAVVGGLALSMSANFAKEGDKVKPQILFHFGRLIGFFVLGGLIGLLGSTLQLNTTANFVLGLIVSIIMLILGVNLLDIFHFTKTMQLTMPKFFSKHTFNMARATHRFMPFVVGIVTFFLPCGFTQSMQIYALSTGNFITGAFTMFVFALGTLPVLALLSFSSFSIQKKSYSGVFFKTAGLFVVVLAVFNIINSLVAGGVISPVFNI